jgi:CheY-like chemotaxis protein
MRGETRPRILVVDDVALFREVEALYLSRVGEVHTARDAAGARALLARERFDVAIVDLHRPDRGGDALCRSELERAEASAPRFVLVTRGQASEYALAVASGAADVLVKPLTRGDLVGAVSRLLASELRGLPRAALREPAHLLARDRISTGTVQNVSRGGAFVTAGWLPREGSELVVEFTLPGQSRTIAAPSRVMWRRPGAQPTGFGVRFVALDGAAQRSLARFVDDHAAEPASPVAS